MIKKQAWNKGMTEEEMKKYPKFDRVRWKKEYREKNKDKIAKQEKEYRIKHKDRFKQIYKNYDDKRKDLKKQQYINHREEHLAKTNGVKRHYLKTWEGFIPLQTKCQICGKDIFFNRKDIKTAIHFDHRNEGAEIIKHPNHFLTGKPRTIENEKIWKSCDFGMLCSLCNPRLPTKNRKEFLIKANKYVFGEGLSL